MVVRYLNVKGIRLDPAEADPPLVVYPNAVLPQPVADEGLQTIPRYRSEIRQRRSRVDLVQLSLRDAGDPLKPPAELAPEDLLGVLVPERSDRVPQDTSATRLTQYSKRQPAQAPFTSQLTMESCQGIRQNS